MRLSYGKWAHAMRPHAAPHAMRPHAAPHAIRPHAMRPHAAPHAMRPHAAPHAMGLHTLLSGVRARLANSNAVYLLKSTLKCGVLPDYNDVGRKKAPPNVIYGA